MIEQQINNLTKRLYPTGRAWFMPINSFFKALHEGLAISEATAYSKALSSLDQILPDNDNFTEDDADAWESKLQIPLSNSLTLEERKIAIKRKMAYPGTIRARQSPLSIQRELRNAGFDVYVHENIVNPARYSTITYGASTMGGNVGFAATTGVVINSLDQADDDAGTQTAIALRSSFFIGGSTISSSANVDATREREFRNLILTLKPLHTYAFLQINYI